MKKFLLASISMLISITCSGCFYDYNTFEGNKNIASISRELTSDRYSLVIKDLNFSFIGISRSKKIVIDENIGNSISLTTDENILGTINIDIDDTSKVITVKGDNDKRYKTESFTLNVGSIIEDITLDGEFSLDINQPNATNFSARLSGAFDGSFNLGKPESFMLDISGASSLKITGECQNSSIEISGASDIDASQFITAVSDVEISGAASAKVYATDSLTAEISGVGDIVYYGNPAIINKDISGLGSIEAGTPGDNS